MVFVSAVFAAGLACDTEGPDEGGDEGTDPKEELCGPTDLYDDFVVGLEKTGDKVTVSFVDAQPAPPIRDFNTWTLAVHDLDGNPVEGADWELFPWMPDHGHGSPTPIVVTESETPGEYVLDPVDLFMAGRWTITMTLSLPDDGGEDEVEFAFCIQ
jgi:hypothetical protein